MNEDSFSLEDRILCSNGACIGVVGSDGRCKVCGTVYEGEEPLPKDDDQSVAPQGVTPEVLAPENYSKEDVALEAEEKSSFTPDASERVCCRDEMCIGIIGKNGICGICGKSA